MFGSEMQTMLDWCSTKCYSCAGFRLEIIIPSNNSAKVSDSVTTSGGFAKDP